MDHFLDQEPKVTSPPEIGWRDVPDAVSARAQLVAFLETETRGIVRIVNGDRLASVSAHHGEARNVGRSIADINHAGKRDGAKLRSHVVIYILAHVEHALVDAEQELRFLRVANDATRKGDSPLRVFGKLASEDGPHVGRQFASVQDRLQSRGNNVVLDGDSVGYVLGREEVVFEFLEHLGQSLVEGETLSEAAQLVVGRPVHLEGVEQYLHVG